MHTKNDKNKNNIHFKFYISFSKLTLYCGLSSMHLSKQAIAYYFIPFIFNANPKIKSLKIPFE